MAKRKRKTRDLESLNRKSRPRSVNVLLFVACEGKTEEEYLRALLNHRYEGRIVLKPIMRGKRAGIRTDIGSLVDGAKRFEVNPDLEGSSRFKGSSIDMWIICDADPDSNETHKQKLINWLKSQNHFAAISANAIEGWLLTHFSEKRPVTPKEALQELRKVYKGYEKGVKISADLISRTDEAYAREKQFWKNQEWDGSSVWPEDRVSQMPNLIDYLDNLAQSRG